MKNKGKLLVFASILVLVAAPAMAQDSANESDSSGEDRANFGTPGGTDDSKDMTVSKNDAERTARQALSDYDWKLEDFSTHEDDGYYRFEFILSQRKGEAEVRVDGSSGETFRYEEEIKEEFKDTDETEESEENETREQRRERAVEVRIETKREQIRRLEIKIAELEREIERLEEIRELDESENETESETEIEARRGRDRAEVEIEREDEETEAEIETESRLNETQNSGRSGQRRPGFVSRMLQGIFN